jgi:hypothetical protein
MYRRILLWCDWKGFSPHHFLIVLLDLILHCEPPLIIPSPPEPVILRALLVQTVPSERDRRTGGNWSSSCTACTTGSDSHCESRLILPTPPEHMSCLECPVGTYNAVTGGNWSSSCTACATGSVNPV